MKYVKNSVGKPDENKPFEKPRRRYEDTIKIDHRKQGLGA